MRESLIFSEPIFGSCDVLAQFECAAGYLVLGDDVSSVENSIRIFLFDRNRGLLDEASIFIHFLHLNSEG
jgi:hypothetical protein